MNFLFDENLATSYKSPSQKIRVMSEAWVAQNVYCPCCGNKHINKQENNKPVSDFYCDYCGNNFELKSKNGDFTKKINDGAYATMIERITSLSNPDLFLLRYSQKLEVVDLFVVPKFFFTPSVIEKRKPLSVTAKRAGWIGCNILVSEIPKNGKISIIDNQRLMPMDNVVEAYKYVSRLQTASMENRGWLFDVLNCIESIGKAEFSLREVYAYVEMLQLRHVDNHNVEAKIRQQLQVLRDKGFIEFMGRGIYRKIYK